MTTNKAGYRKYNDHSQSSSTYHKKDGTSIRAILKADAARTIRDENNESSECIHSIIDERSVEYEKMWRGVQTGEVSELAWVEYCDSLTIEIMKTQEFCDIMLRMATREKVNRNELQ